MQQTEQNEIFELAYRFVSETNENIFLTGKAGTGKTTFLKYLKEHVAKNIVVAAPTGVAAINAGGVTLHSLFQLPFHPFLPNAINKDALLSKLRSNKQKLQLLRKMDLLVIDEISMVRCDTLDAIDTVLRSVRRNYQAPFGGAQVLYIGDLYQLPPVAQQQEWNILSEYYQTPFFFDSLVIKEQKPLLIELNKVYRQRDDAFVDLLNKVRTNNLSAADFEILNSRFIPGFYADPGKKFITLTSHNNIADNINQQRLSRLAAPPFTYNAVIEGDFPENMYPAEAALVLREGAQVMFLKNDAMAKKYFNGKIGVVLSLEKDKIMLDDKNDNTFNRISGKTLVADVNAGVYLYGKNYSVGFAAPQLMENKLRMGDELFTERLQRHYLIFASYTHKLNAAYALTPSVLFKTVKSASPPSQLDATLKVSYKQFLWAGASYRWDISKKMSNACVAFFGVSQLNFSFGYSFDYNLGLASQFGNGSHELFFSYNIVRKKKE